ncbi:MAG TPA: hypothetical protein VK854_05765 [Woeseiaceae bacterium]|nr:hypothetical protein [Woeseiaceae bacterium]
MNAATHQDIARLFPGIEDHTVVEILGTHATLGDIEAAVALLQDADEGLIGVKQRHGDRINRVLDILAASDFRPDDLDEA